MTAFDTPGRLTREQMIALISNDAYAMTFQTMGQYRSALFAALAAEGETPPVTPPGETKTQ